MLTFGTDGIRGKADAYPFLQEPLEKIGQAIALWAKETYEKESIHVLIGHDTRESCEYIKTHLTTGLCLESTTDLSVADLSVVDGSTLPTPAILQLIQHDPTFDFGIVISASHNPYQDNGIKLFDATRGKLSKEDEATIIGHFEAFTAPSTRGMLCITSQWPEAQEVYIQNVCKHFEKNFLQGITVVLDCANGATHHVAPHIFSTLGAEVIPIGTIPNGKNINKDCGALHTEHIQQTVIKHQAHVGFAFDGDGDRVIAINKHGERKDGDDILALLLQHKDFSSETSVVGTIMTNYGFETFLQNQNKTLTRTKVGDKYVSAHMKAHNITLGGEASGHIIIQNYLDTGDGIFVALKTLESIIQHNNWDMKTFVKTPQILINVPVTHKEDLSQEPYVTIIKNAEKTLINGRIVVRYSGTENLLRIMVEDTTTESAQRIAQDLSSLVAA